MDPVSTLVTGVMTVLMPYVTKGAEEFAKAAGDVAFRKAKGLIDTLRAKLAGDKEASESLTRLEEKPERYKPVVEDVLKEKLSQDTALAAEVERQLKDMAPELEIIQRIKGGEAVTGLEADEVTGGRVKVTQDIEQGKNITGAKIKRLGR